MFKIENDTLLFDERVITTSLPEETYISQKSEHLKEGVFLEFSKNSPFAVTTWNGIKCSNITRFTALHHDDLYWLYPRFGKQEKDLPLRTAVAWMERNDGYYIILAALIDKGYSMYLNGEESGISIIADNNCKTGKERILTGLYVGVSKNPYRMMDDAARNILKFVNVGKLRTEKKLPEWVDKLGYCTWNTFYMFINQTKIIRMLKKFKEKGIEPRYFILDDGWQKIRLFKLLNKGIKQRKFPEGLKKFINLCKSKFEIEHFLVWHTAQGYWWGINSTGVYGKQFKPNLKRVKPIIGASSPSELSWQRKTGKILNNLLAKLGWRYGILMPDKIKLFYDDYHSWLKSEGVEGVKVDNQFGMPIFTYNQGYIATIMKEYMRVLEESVSKHFSESDIINCMSLNHSILFQLKSSNITRNYMDYFPKKEKEQISHIINNAFSNFWTGQFVHPDWDMFQTANRLGWGPYQGAARAISGSPVYLSEEFEKIDIDLLKKIALPNGEILRCKDIALPCKDCLFTNPCKDGRALKIFNHNKFNSVLGIFNVLKKKETKVKYNPSDIETFNEGMFIAYEFNNNRFQILEANQSLDLYLNTKGFEIITIAPIQDGFSLIGIITMYNCGGIFNNFIRTQNKIEIELKYGGLIIFYSEKSPRKVEFNEKEVTFDYDVESKLLRIRIMEKQENLRLKIQL